MTGKTQITEERQTVGAHPSWPSPLRIAAHVSYRIVYVSLPPWVSRRIPPHKASRPCHGPNVPGDDAVMSCALSPGQYYRIMDRIYVLWYYDPFVRVALWHYGIMAGVTARIMVLWDADAIYDPSCS